MKKTLLFIISAIVLFSCKKNSTTYNIGIPENTITLTTNGTVYTYNKEEDFTEDGDSSYFNIYSYVSANNFSTSSYMEVEIASSGKFNIVLKPKKYCYYLDTTTAAGFEFYLAGVGDFSSGYNKVNPFIITLTSYTPTVMQGTFSGPIYIGGDTTTTPLTITGKFNLNL
jgi:hypothetical protein